MFCKMEVLPSPRDKSLQRWRWSFGILKIFEICKGCSGFSKIFEDSKEFDISKILPILDFYDSLTVLEILKVLVFPGIPRLLCACLIIFRTA